MEFSLTEHQTIRVLLVDDDEDEYVITRDLFREIGSDYQIRWANTFDSGIEEISKNAYDICLLDFHLGDRTGIDFVKDAVFRGVGVPIILLTGQADREMDIDAMKAGTADFLEKGELNARILERAVRYALERKKSEERIRHLAFYDQLTDLPNRTLFLDRLQNALVAAKRHDRKFAMLFIDIDNFKRINDTVGHTLGDRLIVEVARRLYSCVRKDDAIVRERFGKMIDTVARLGGDEFTILLAEIRAPENVLRVIARIQDAFREQIDLGSIKVGTTLSIGVSIFPADGEDAESLLKNADLAMYDAKISGKNTFQYYNAGMNASSRMRLAMENDLRSAFDRGEFAVYYQPIVDCATHDIVCVEALIRWNHPERGIVLPSEFIPIAEESGMSYDIGVWTIRTVLADYSRWRAAGAYDGMIEVNVSSRQLVRKNLIEKAYELKSEFGIPDRTFVFDIATDCIARDCKDIPPLIDEIRAAGILTSIDNFGGGSSSFGILKKLKFDMLKMTLLDSIDVVDDAPDAAIASSLIEIGHSLGMKVVAVGIDRKSQYDFFVSRHCDYAQGFYFCEPVSEPRIREVMARGFEHNP